MHSPEFNSGDPFSSDETQRIALDAIKDRHYQQLQETDIVKKSQASRAVQAFAFEVGRYYVGQLHGIGQHGTSRKLCVIAESEDTKYKTPIYVATIDGDTLELHSDFTQKEATIVEGLIDELQEQKDLQLMPNLSLNLFNLYLREQNISQ